MRQSDIRETMVMPLISVMNLMDMEIHTDNDGEVQEVILKYVPSYKGPEPLSGSVYLGRSHISRDAMA